jgi:hypothetical protein
VKLAHGFTTQCPLLNGLKRLDIRDDDIAFDAFSQRLAPLFENMARIAPPVYNDSPLLYVTLDSWMVGDQVAYSLSGLHACDSKS